MAKERLLLLEDETNVGSTLAERLRMSGYSVTWVESLGAAREELASNQFDLGIFDVGLPDGSGFDLASEVRKQGIQISIIFLTAFGTPEDRIFGLELGAEDYIVKPFHFKELLLRIQNGLKRTQVLSVQSEVSIGGAQVSFDRHEVWVDGRSFPLTRKETDLLKLLVGQRGRTVSRDEILDRVWSRDEYPSPRTVDNFILKLRKIFEKNPDQPAMIRSVRGVGYQLMQEQSE